MRRTKTNTRTRMKRAGATCSEGSTHLSTLPRRQPRSLPTPIFHPHRAGKQHTQRGLRVNQSTRCGLPANNTQHGTASRHLDPNPPVGKTTTSQFMDYNSHTIKDKQRHIGPPSPTTPPLCPLTRPGKGKQAAGRPAVPTLGDAGRRCGRRCGRRRRRRRGGRRGGRRGRGAGRSGGGEGRGHVHLIGLFLVCLAY